MASWSTTPFYLVFANGVLRTEVSLGNSFLSASARYRAVKAYGVDPGRLTVEVGPSLDTFLKGLFGPIRKNRMGAKDVPTVAVKEFPGNESVFSHVHAVFLSK